jgi:hypothetical protein
MKKSIRDKTGKCKKCGCDHFPNDKQIRQFGYVCLKCVNEQRKEYRNKRKEMGIKINKNPATKEYYREYRKNYVNRPGVKERYAELSKKYRNDPDKRMKHTARWLVARAITSNKILKQPCEICGNVKVDAHHDDYYKPLEVRWLCRSHHVEWHKNNKVLGDK